MNEWIIHSIIAYSITLAYMESDIFFRIRSFVKKRIHPGLANCYHCMGFYISIITYILFDEKWNFDIIDIIAHALFSCAMIVFYDKLLTLSWLLIKRLKKANNMDEESDSKGSLNKGKY